MKLSIIICAYNTKKEYLCKCLESIKGSTLSKYENEYEICLVDDGSTLDYSDLVCDFGVKYKKTENKGIFSARKTGIELSSGEYAIFVDSDDCVSFNYHLPMLNEAIKSGADIVINDWAFYNGSLRYYPKNDPTIKNNLDLKGIDALGAFLSNKGKSHSFFVLWNKLFKASILKNAVKKIKEIDSLNMLSYGEDALINFFAFKEAKYVKNVHVGYYFYRTHENQVVNTSSYEGLKKQVLEMSKVLDIMEENIKNETEEKMLSAHIKEWRALCARFHYSRARAEKYSDLYDYIKEQYGVFKNQKAKGKDSRAYFSKKLLGDNFEEVEKSLKSLWQSSSAKNVEYKNDAYTKASIKFLLSEGKITADSTHPYDIKIPKLKSSLKHKLIYNPFLYRIGLLVFRKNSKIRGKLKKHI